MEKKLAVWLEVQALPLIQLSYAKRKYRDLEQSISLIRSTPRLTWCTLLNYKDGKLHNFLPNRIRNLTDISIICGKWRHRCLSFKNKSCNSSFINLLSCFSTYSFCQQWLTLFCIRIICLEKNPKPLITKPKQWSTKAVSSVVLKKKIKCVLS